jgi:hypothetical protein
MSFIVNRKVDRQFKTFEEAVKCAVESFNKRYAKPKEYVLTKTPKGWTIKAKNPFKYNNCSYPNTQFIQEI